MSQCKQILALQHFIDVNFIFIFDHLCPCSYVHSFQYMYVHIYCYNVSMGGNITIDPNPAYETTTTIKMDTNPAYAATTY